MLTATATPQVRTLLPESDEVRGEVERVVYRDVDSGFVVVKLKSGLTVIGEDPDEDIRENSAYHFLGRWETQGKYGRRLKFDVFALDIPGYERSIISYLTEHCDGIGQRRAEKLFQAFGEKAVEVLRTDPARAAQECGLSEADALTASESLQIIAGDETAKVDLYRLLCGRGFSRKLTSRIVRAYRRSSPEVVQRNPFMLATQFGQPLKRTDKLYLDLGHDPAAMKRQCVWAIAGASSMDGSTWVEREEAIAAVYKQCGRDEAKISPDRAIQVAARANAISECSIDGVLHVSPFGKARSESRLADKLRRLSACTVKWPAIGKESGLSEHQLGEFSKSLAGTVGLLLGTPGTGKTYSTAQLVKKLIEKHGDNAVAVVAPTGKAAVRITAAMFAAGVSIQATTIHRLLGYRPGADGAEGGFEHNINNPLDQKYIVVDESSMIDTSLAASLVEACSAGTHILFVGDPYQLPPVGHGAPLRDMQAAGLPCGLLTEIRRNAGLIVHGCTKIKDGLAPKFADRVDLAAGDNLKLYDKRSARDQLDMLAVLLAKIRDNHLADDSKPHPIWGVQVLVAMNSRSEIARKIVNDMLQNLLNGNAAGAVQKYSSNTFRPGDKIICLRNGQYAACSMSKKKSATVTNAEDWDYQRGIDQDTGKSPRLEHYIANGEIGECLAVANSCCVFRFEAPDRYVRVPVGRKSAGGDSDDDGGEDRGMGCNFDLAYAVTCHKSQGSQWPVVIILLDEGAGYIATREWHYTAISRAEQLAICIGKPEVLDRQVRKQALQSRKTFLANLIKGESDHA